MNCPECKGLTDVLSTRTTGEGVHQKVRRRRRCVHCRERFSTVERLECRKSAEALNRRTEESPKEALIVEGETSVWAWGANAAKGKKREKVGKGRYIDVASTWAAGGLSPLGMRIPSLLPRRS